MSGNFETASAVMVLLAIPSEVIWAYFAGGVVFAIGLGAMFLRGDWQKARGLDKLILFGPLFYAAPVAAFGTEHFTLTAGVASIIPAWIPWHLFWAYLVGACLIAGALSVVTGIQARLAAGLLGLTFFLFVVLMHGPGWAQDPRNRFALTVALRELSFSGGALALAASLAGKSRERGTDLLATIARYFVAIPVLFFSLEQFLHGDHVPGVPLKPADSGVRLRTRPLDVCGGRGLRGRGRDVAFWEENARRGHMAGVDGADCGVGCLCADRSCGTRQPREWA